MLSDRGWKHSTMVFRSIQGKFISGVHSGFRGLHLHRAMRPAVGGSGWWSTLLLTLTLAVGLGIPQAQARRTTPEVSVSADTIGLSQLPREGQTVYQRILSGGPFAYEKDGTVFGNRERLLPRQPRGFYREYTVRTPGERDRGARRIVCGGKDVRQPETCFYTRDHYQSFQLIDASR